MNLKKPNPGESLAEKKPDLVQEWDFEKNNGLTPDDVSYGSNIKVWWKCNQGHSYMASIKHKYYCNSGCPYCAPNQSKVISGENDFATTHPQLAAEWHPTKNGDLKPTDVRSGSHKKVWWQCSKGHEWQAIVNDRSHGRGCPYCAGKNILVGYNDLATTHPHLALEWNQDNNGELKVTDVSAGSNKKVWWKCSKGHEWKAVISSRSRGRGCPYCKANGTSYGEQYIYWALKQLYPDAKNRFKTTNSIEYDIFIPSIKLAIEYSGAVWHKGKEEHDQYKRELAESNGIRFIDIIEDQRNNKLLVGNNHYEYNPIIMKDESLKKIISMILVSYGHSESEIDIKHVQNKALEYSKGKIEYKESLEYLYPNITKEWQISKNYGIAPSEVTPGSDRRVWWKCSKGHEWQAIIRNRTKNNSACPFCSIEKQSYFKSMPKPGKSLMDKRIDIAYEWHPTKNGNLKPTDVSYGSNKKIWWQCKKGHEWQATIANRTSNNSKCPYCAGKRKVLNIDTNEV